MGPAKHAKRRERGREVWAGRPAHVTSRDPTLDAVGTRSCAIRRGMSKKRATAIFDLSLLSRLTGIASGKPSSTGTQGMKSRLHRRPQRTRRPIRNWVSVTTRLCLRNGAREETRKGVKGEN